ncbi:ribosome hibernation-promoting factor, HPF/YfiA family [Corynebacterium otitidis]|uniref:Ribosome hibernation promoting factor n=1 Tax=Corynebacterium otitidis ATCC 51513 TaxID=883169 RepID=I7JW57_9CORY|nr:ribosome-associated translation inhibitor RaiA [Corynebacterium otitidis]EJZ81933.1 ribosomal subunit interface protein [Corynebacterium otitidis ATCC 51513]KKO84343.1 hypothetical protein AAV33_01470 [Corynebacterium otitidis]CCI83671.1 hypothetical protein BN46_0943 [Corynebacterium otitidis ATCC 51513]
MPNTSPQGRDAAQVQITGRNVEVPEHFADRVNDKLSKVERLDPSLTHFVVLLRHENNPRLEDRAERVEITATGSGHVARAEAAEDSFYAALESAVGKMERSLRKVKARRKIAQSGHRVPKSTGEIAAELAEEAERSKEPPADPYEDQVEFEEPGQIVRTKRHPGKPISVDDALSEMELVGHDFFLFVNEETKRPSVVYRRHAYDYGLIELTEA